MSWLYCRLCVSWGHSGTAVTWLEISIMLQVHTFQQIRKKVLSRFTAFVYDIYLSQKYWDKIPCRLIGPLSIDLFAIMFLWRPSPFFLFHLVIEVKSLPNIFDLHFVYVWPEYDYSFHSNHVWYQLKNWNLRYEVEWESKSTALVFIQHMMG